MSLSEVEASRTRAGRIYPFPESLASSPRALSCPTPPACKPTICRSLGGPPQVLAHRRCWGSKEIHSAMITVYMRRRRSTARAAGLALRSTILWESVLWVAVSPEAPFQELFMSVSRQLYNMFCLPPLLITDATQQPVVVG
jgi:hypothetical protein